MGFWPLSNWSMSILRGLKRHINDFNKDWQVTLRRGDETLSDITMKEIIAQTDIILYSITLKSKEKYLKELIAAHPEIPILGTSGAFDGLIPVIRTDDYRCGQLAARHLMGKGFKQFAYASRKYDGKVGEERYHGFSDELEAEGYSCAVKPNEEKIKNWMEELKKPVGIFFVDDQYAFWLMSQMDIEKYNIPYETGIISVQTDEAICLLGTPHISGIDTNIQEYGYKVGELIEEVFEGNHKEISSLTIPPKGVVERDTTAEQAVDDPVIIKAMELINKGLSTGVNVMDLLKALLVSRRALENKFKQKYELTPHQMIVEKRLAKAQQLLQETDMTLDNLAEHCGYNSRELLYTTFKKRFDMTPSRYRAQYRNERN